MKWAAAISLVLFGLYFAEQHTSFRVFDTVSSMGIMFPTVATLVIWPGAYFAWRSAMQFYRNAFEMEATVVKVGMCIRQFQDVIISYQFGPKLYHNKISLFKTQVDRLFAGCPVKILVDRRNPKRIKVHPDYGISGVL
jgi:hypothetical protein